MNTEAAEVEIPVVGVIDGDNVYLDPAIVAAPHPAGIHLSVWRLLPAETRQEMGPYITGRDDHGVWCWMSDAVYKRFLPAIVKASRRKVLIPGIDHVAFSAFLDQVQVAREQRRLQEILDWSRETGNPLPMTADAVLAFEDAGAVVDLETGWISWPNGINVWGGNLVGAAAVTSEA